MVIEEYEEAKFLTVVWREGANHAAGIFGKYLAAQSAGNGGSWLELPGISDGASGGKPKSCRRNFQKISCATRRSHPARSGFPCALFTFLPRALLNSRANSQRPLSGLTMLLLHRLRGRSLL